MIAQSVAEVWKLEGPEGLKQRFGASVSTQDDASGADGDDAFKTCLLYTSKDEEE